MYLLFDDQFSYCSGFLMARGLVGEAEVEGMQEGTKERRGEKKILNHPHYGKLMHGQLGQLDNFWPMYSHLT